MKKVLPLVLCLLLCLCPFINATAEGNGDYRVLHSITDFNSFADTEQLWDSQSPYGYIYAFESPTTTADLVTDENGNKSVKCVFRGGGQYSHWHSWTIDNWASVKLYQPSGFRIRVKTVDKPISLIIRMDFNSGANYTARYLLTNRNLFAYNSNGTRYTGNVNGLITLPANFDGYIYYPLNIEGTLAGANKNVTLADLENLDTVVIFAYPANAASFGDGTTVYIDDFELYADSSYSYTPSVGPVFSPTPIVPVTIAPGNTTAPETPVITPEPTPVPTAEPTAVPTAELTAEPTATATVTATDAPTRDDVTPQSSLVSILAGIAIIIAASVIGLLFHYKKNNG